MTTTTNTEKTTRNLASRINRALARDGERLRRCRADSQAFRELGEFYVTNAGDFVTAKHVDLRALARELRVRR
jgi:hypothetical protein